MRWHADVLYHPNQFGFAAAVSFIDPQELDTAHITFACHHCGANAPQAILELSVFLWTLFVVAHAKEEQ